MKKTPSNDYEVYALKKRVEALEERNHNLEIENARLLRDIEHLTNLSVPLVSKELGKSIHRSVKFRVTRAIWGKERFYQSNEALLQFDRPIQDQVDADEAIKIIRENDRDNVAHLSGEPSRSKVAVYEAVRKISHAPRRAGRIIKRRTAS